MTETLKKWKEVRIDKKDTESKKVGYQTQNYTAWQVAWRELMQHYPDAIITQLENANGMPYFGDEDIGYIVKVRLQIPSINFDFTEYLTILDSQNLPQFKVIKKFFDAKDTQKTVYPFTAADICNTIQRCIVKATARAGIGLNVYEGDFSDVPSDVPSVDRDVAVKVESISEKQLTAIDNLLEPAGKTAEKLCKIYKIQSLRELSYDNAEKMIQGLKKLAAERTQDGKRLLSNQ